MSSRLGISPKRFRINQKQDRLFHIQQVWRIQIFLSRVTDPFAAIFSFNCWKALMEIFECAAKTNGLWLPTATDEKPQWFYPVLGPLRCDLQTAYKVSRQFGSNFERLQRGCNNCDIPGCSLDLILPKPQ
mmetsp:Transcript_26351/g.37099  ORF Transcript_26351/g.37099 Transcript_26351/m.37099 type:complete len:130 (-) Transcript_26351:280-669(-)